MLTARHLAKTFDTRGPLAIIDDVSLDVKPGESVAILGPSGCGKSTLLYILGALEPPTSGSITLDGQNPFELTEPQLARFRNRSVGFVFQDHLLLPQLSALENVLIPTAVDKHHQSDAAADRARTLLAAVGLEQRLDHRPAELSGGERQRVAIARALVRSPALLLCDEPTGNLDRAAADSVADLLVSLHEQQHTMLIVVTHSPVLAARLGRRYALADRKIGRAHV